MLNKIQVDEFYNFEELSIHHDAHIRAYQSQKMGIKVVLCNSEGIPVHNTVAPMSSYLPKTAYNM